MVSRLGQLGRISLESRNGVKFTAIVCKEILSLVLCTASVNLGGANCDVHKSNTTTQLPRIEKRKEWMEKHPNEQRNRVKKLHKHISGHTSLMKSGILAPFLQFVFQTKKRNICFPKLVYLTHQLFFSLLIFIRPLCQQVHYRKLPSLWMIVHLFAS
jgi:hypothetical protein